MATLVLQSAGAAFGAGLGGPIGAVLGQTVGAVAGAAVPMSPALAQFQFEAEPVYAECTLAHAPTRAPTRSRARGISSRAAA